MNRKFKHGDVVLCNCFDDYGEAVAVVIGFMNIIGVGKRIVVQRSADAFFNSCQGFCDDDLFYIGRL